MFYLMNDEKKQKWKCLTCLSQPRRPSLATPPAVPNEKNSIKNKNPEKNAVKAIPQQTGMQITTNLQAPGPPSTHEQSTLIPISSNHSSPSNETEKSPSPTSEHRASKPPTPKLPTTELPTTSKPPTPKQSSPKPQTSKNNLPSPNLDESKGNESLEYVTVRTKYNVPIYNSFSSLSEDDTFDISSTKGDTIQNRSFPDLSCHYKTEIEELSKALETLAEKQESADLEIEHLMLENNELRKKLTAYELEIKKSRSICKTTPKRSMTKHKHTPNSTPRTKAQQRDSLLQQSLQKMRPAVKDIEANKNESHKVTIGDETSSSQIDITSNVVPCQKTTPTLYILGGKQCRGLASALIETRKNTNYEKYKIISYIKPNAQCEDILKNSEVQNATSNDVVVINVGDSDCNPTKICSELSYFLKCNTHPLVIMLSVKSSKYLNENKLNETLQLCSNTFQNCNFIDLSNCDNNRDFIRNLCNKINMFIDTKYYEKTFLGYKNKKFLGKLKRLDAKDTKLNQKKITDYFITKNQYSPAKIIVWTLILQLRNQDEN
ncbi:hypothetical protein O0L34_g19220 [Tuta absoluta]|nr:hypothetical protein O0L34_g19220 [Tuta absoluta]